MQNFTVKQVRSLTGLGDKTVRYFHKVLYPDDTSKVKIFTLQDVDYIKSLQLGKFDVVNELVQVPGFEYYWVSKKGEIYSYHRKFFEKVNGYVDKRTGYLIVRLWDSKSNRSRNYRFNRIMALTFLSNPCHLPVVHHKDHNRLNNNIDNLEWVTVSENTQAAYDEGYAYNDKGEDDSQSMPINVIWKNGKQQHFGSISEAQRLTGISKSTFINNANGSTKNSRYFRTVEFCDKQMCND